MTPEQIVELLAGLKSENAFNQYAQTCPLVELPGAAEVRRENLIRILTEAQKGVDEIWIALEPSQKGARRTGLAMTDVARLAAHGDRFGVTGLRVATKPRHPRETTATAVWRQLEGRAERVFLWNTVALYTHRPGEPLQNRRHTDAERRMCAPINRAIIELLSPKRLIAIGADAQTALEKEGFASTRVRHPANGGAALFAAQMRAIARD